VRHAIDASEELPKVQIQAVPLHEPETAGRARPGEVLEPAFGGVIASKAVDAYDLVPHLQQSVRQVRPHKLCRFRDQDLIHQIPL